ncbi:MAG: CARDB domain-containing protein, partial [Bacteroidota bacterium]
IANLYADIINASNIAASNIQVQVFVAGVSIKDTTLDLGPLEQQSLIVSWPAVYGNDLIRILVDSVGLHTEVDESNNELILNANVLDIIPPIISNVQYTPQPVYLGQNFLLQLKTNDNAGIASVQGLFQGQNIALNLNPTSGFYEANFQADTVGIHQAICTSTDVNGLSSSVSLLVEVLPSSIDLSIAPQDIIITGTGNNQQIQTTIYNNGNQVANNFDVNIYVDGILFDSTNISLGPGSTMINSSGFMACGNHTIEVKLDEVGALTESNEANNSAITSFSNCNLLPPQILNFEISPNPVAVNDNFVLSLTLMDTTGIDSVIVILPTGNVLLVFNPANQKYENISSLPNPGVFPIVANAADRAGQSSSIQSILEVEPNLAELKVTALSPSSNPVYLGQQSQVTYAVANSGLKSAFNARVEIWQDNILVSDFTNDFYSKDTTILSISWIPISSQTDFLI